MANLIVVFLGLSKSDFDLTDTIKCDGDFFLRCWFYILVLQYNVTNESR